MTADGPVNQVLEERGRTHGLFSENAVLTMETRAIWHAAPNWQHLSPSQQLALDEIALKVARILSTGTNPKDTEHWLDGAGYFTLGARHA